jgi:hypothetical protein
VATLPSDGHIDVSKASEESKICLAHQFPPRIAVFFREKQDRCSAALFQVSSRNLRTSAALSSSIVCINSMAIDWADTLLVLYQSMFDLLDAAVH